MKVAIFADTHLTDQFDPEKYDYLEAIIRRNDKIVVNGDLWEGQIINFDQFINSKWSKLFPLLKEKETVYTFGNHDKKSFMDNRYSLFSEQAVESYILKIDGLDKPLYITHGDKYINYPLTKYRTHPLFLKSVSYPNRKRLAVENWVGRKVGWKKAEYFSIKRDQERLRRIALKEFSDQILVASHVHYPSLELENNYLNTGMIHSHLASYIQIEDDKITLIKETY